jgi:cobaltochelatase CobN
MWAEPDPGLLAELQQAYLDTEGDLEGGETTAQQSKDPVPLLPRKLG